MRTASAGMTAHLANQAQKRCYLLRLDLRDGTSLGVTDHNENIVSTVIGGSLNYSAATGIFPSDISFSTGLEADNYEVSGPISATVTQEAILGGRYNRATARLAMVNWSDLTDGSLSILKGYVSEARIEGGKFVLQIRSDADRFNQTVGRLITPYCSADFGDSRCGVTPEEITGTVTAVTDAMRFTVSFSGSYANDYFNKGTVTFTSGALSGTDPIEIEDWTSGGAITLFTFAAESPTIGDTMTIKRGCGKTRADCMAYSNILNFRGFPEVPGTDQVLKMPVPGA